jgi:hypothetical protein
MRDVRPTPVVSGGGRPGRQMPDVETEPSRVTLQGGDGAFTVNI